MLHGYKRGAKNIGYSSTEDVYLECVTLLLLFNCNCICDAIFNVALLTS
jgi:hypothetical protein